MNDVQTNREIIWRWLVSYTRKIKKKKK